MHRLDEQGKVVPGFAGLFEFSGRGVGGEEQYLAIGDGADQSDAKIDAVHPRHPDVGDEDVRWNHRSDVQGGLGVVGGVGDEAELGDLSWTLLFPDRYGLTLLDGILEQE
jgi:hypothetical protein